MMFDLHVECDNAAFEDNLGQELARILIEIAQEIRQRSDDDVTTGRIFDINGNRVGQWEVVD